MQSILTPPEKMFNSVETILTRTYFFIYGTVLFEKKLAELHLLNSNVLRQTLGVFAFKPVQ